MPRHTLVCCKDCGKWLPLSDATDESDCEWGQAVLVTITPLPAQQVEPEIEPGMGGTDLLS